MEPNPTLDAAASAPDPAPELERSVYLQLVHEMMSTMPASIDIGPDKRAALDRRIQTSVALVAAMLPATAEEADLAVRVVVAGAHANDCLRDAVQLAADPAQAMKARAQAASMGREARGFRSLLLRLQAARQKREANDKAREAAAWTELSVAGMMKEGVESIPAEQVAEADTAARDAKLAAEADRYAINHPRRVQVMRQHEGVPEDCQFQPPRAALVRAIVSGNSPHLRAASSLPIMAR